jgi:hypothetical protein
LGPGYGGGWGIFIEAEVCLPPITQRALPALNVFIEPGLHASQTCSIYPSYHIFHTQPEACMHRPFQAWLYRYSNTPQKFCPLCPIRFRVRPQSFLLLRFCQRLSSSICSFLLVTHLRRRSHRSHHPLQQLQPRLLARLSQTNAHILQQRRMADIA